MTTRTIGTSAGGPPSVLVTTDVIVKTLTVLAPLDSDDARDAFEGLYFSLPDAIRALMFQRTATPVNARPDSAADLSGRG
jgi:hypothetical protein